MTRIFVIAFVALTLGGCRSHGAVETKPVTASSAVAPRDTDGVVAGFTNDIWPAINARNGVIAQGGPADQQFAKIRADDASLDLRSEVEGLGIPNDTLYRDPAIGLRLASVDLAALDPPNATLTACYTYTLINQDKTVHRPMASQLRAVLDKTDAWYLRDLTDDHVVAGCPTNKA